MSNYNYSDSLNKKDGRMYKALTSNSLVKKSIAKAIMDLSKLSGSEKRVKKSNIKKQEKRKNELKQFLEENDTKQKLNNININPQLFKVAVLRNYYLDVSNFKNQFDKLLKYASNKKINSKKIDDIVEKMVSNNFTLADDDFLSEDKIKTRKLSKLKINNEMIALSLPNISELSPFLPFKNKFGQVGAALKKTSVSKKRFTKKKSVSKKR